MKKFSVVLIHMDEFLHTVVDADDWLSALVKASPPDGAMFSDRDITYEDAQDECLDNDCELSIIEIK